MLIFLTQCDYKPIYSQNNQNFGIRIIEFNENRSNKILAKRLENYSYKKNNLFLYELKLLTSENKLIDSTQNVIEITTKLESENVVLENSENVVVRASVLYGCISNILAKLESSSKKPINFGQWLINKLILNEFS